MYARELKIAIQAVKKAEKTFRKYHGTKKQVEIKEGNYLNLVSYADKKIERDTKNFLLKNFPTYGFIGEEYGNINEQAELRWALDPIDGTSNYLQGLPDCAISLGLLKKERPVVGVVSVPFLGKFYTARLGGGAKLNDRPIHVAKTQDIKSAFGSVGWGRDIEFAMQIVPCVLPHIFKLRVPGSAALGICYVAEGLYDFFIDRSMKIWDFAAGQIILEEAGGRLVASPSKIKIATNSHLGTPFLKLLKRIE